MWLKIFFFSGLVILAPFYHHLIEKFSLEAGNTNSGRISPPWEIKRYLQLPLTREIFYNYAARKIFYTITPPPLSGKFLQLPSSREIFYNYPSLGRYFINISSTEIFYNYPYLGRYFTITLSRKIFYNYPSLGRYFTITPH